MISRTFDLPSIGPRTYVFPTVFEDVQALVGLALVPHDAAVRWLPEPLQAVRLPTGRALLMVTFQDLRKPTGMAPYQEASLAVLATAPGGARGFHVLTMPVTSRENHARGNFIFGYPKEMADIRIDDDESGLRGSVHVDGAHLLSASVSRGLGIPRAISIPSRHIQLLRGELVSVTTRIGARVRLARGHIETGPLFQARWPGAPAVLRMVTALQLRDARFELNLPEPLRT